MSHPTHFVDPPAASAPPASASVRDGAKATARLSLVIPCWKDEAAALAHLARWREHPWVVDVCIGGLTERTEFAQAVRAGGGRFAGCPRPSRGQQLNAAAAEARGDILLFHHADSILTPEHLAALQQLDTQAPGFRGGAFYRKFDERHPWLRWLEQVERWRSRSHGTLFGDQSVFVRRSVFEELGGFAGIPLMEDVDFSNRLRRSGPVVLLDPPMASSPRKHLQQGAWRTTLRNASLLLLFQLGVDPARLHRWYYAEGPARS
ncbi:MAG: glycosyltransferase family 2 protein [Verrucomicrobia bacterium]|nr:glycosyltransferase family 2 protein [Verrucomicrobiota bacterium]